MAANKEPIEITCAKCRARFRLWIPADDLAEWEEGAPVSCVRCGAPYMVRKADGAGFDVEAVAPLPVEAVPAAVEEPGAATAPEAAFVETVLVVEDDGLSRKMVENTLKDTDYRVILAKNGEEALRVLRTEGVTLLVVDLYLKNPDDPDARMDGEEVLKRADELGFKIPAIVTTGKELVDDVALDRKWFSLHVKGFIQKGNPFWVDELKEKVTDIISKK
ncbi:MAG: response regulator [Thermodesulfobacteriota bacterium]